MVAAACAKPELKRNRGNSVAMLIPNRQLTISRELAAGYEAGAGQVPGISPFVDGPDSADATRAVEIFNRLARTSPAGVSFFNLYSELFEELPDAAAAGVPLIAVANPVSDTNVVTLFVGNDNYDIGRVLARTVLDQLGPWTRTGKVVLGTPVPGASVFDLRVSGIRREIAALRPDMTVLGPFDSKSDPLANRAAWSVLVEAHRDAVAFIGAGDVDSFTLGQLRLERDGMWRAGAFSLDPRILDWIAAGDLVTVSPEHFLQGAIAGQLQAECAAGHRDLPRGWVYGPGRVVTSENVAAIRARQESDRDLRVNLLPQSSAIVADLDAHLRPLDSIRSSR